MPRAIGEAGMGSLIAILGTVFLLLLAIGSS